MGHGHLTPRSESQETPSPADLCRRRHRHPRCTRIRPLGDRAGGAESQSIAGLDRCREARRDEARGARPGHAGAEGSALDRGRDGGASGSIHRQARCDGDRRHRDHGTVESGSDRPVAGRAVGGDGRRSGPCGAADEPGIAGAGPAREHGRHRGRL